MITIERTFATFLIYTGPMPASRLSLDGKKIAKGSQYLKDQWAIEHQLIPHLSKPDDDDDDDNCKAKR